MQLKRKQWLIICLTALIYLNQFIPASGCAVCFPAGTYAYACHPDIPLKKYAQGELGIVHPQLAMSYLTVAYRYLINKPLNPLQQKAADDLWLQRLGSFWDHPDDYTNPWLQQRNKLPGLSKIESNKISIYRCPPGEYREYQLAGKDAFVTAGDILQERIKKYGLKSNPVKIWASNQDKVFENCTWNEPKEVILPQPLNDNADALCIADYKYQVAAANFYAGKLDSAISLFEQIASDKHSPYHQLAKYLVARCTFQRLVMNKQIVAGNAEALKTEKDFQALLSDPDIAPYKDGIQNFLNYFSFYLHPMERYHYLVSAVLNPENKNFKQDLADYTLMIDYLSNNQEQALPEECRNDDITDWITCFQSVAASPNKFEAHILEKWQHNTASLPWLIAALTVCNKNSLPSKDLISAAQNLPVTSPGYLTAQYYIANLLVEKNQKAKAKKILDDLLKLNLNHVPPSAHNMLLMSRQKLATSLDEFFQYGLKRPAAITFWIDSRTLPQDYDKIKNNNYLQYAGPATFDSRLANAINHQLPLSWWHKLALDSSLPSRLHKEIIAATWIRAILLNDNELALSLAPKLQTAYPQLKSFIDSYINAKQPAQYRFAAAYLMSRNPGLSAYINGDLGRYEKNIQARTSFSDNFWTPDNPDKKQPASDSTSDNPSESADDLATCSVDLNKYLSASEKQVTLSQARILFSPASPSRFFFAAAKDWMKINPADPRIPELLYVITKLPRWVYDVSDSSKNSKAAFHILHSQYPGNPWTNKAQYYY